MNLSTPHVDHTAFEMDAIFKSRCFCADRDAYASNHRCRSISISLSLFLGRELSIEEGFNAALVLAVEDDKQKEKRLQGEEKEQKWKCLRNSPQEKSD